MLFFRCCINDFLINVYRFEKKNYFCREIECCIAKNVVTCNPISCLQCSGKDARVVEEARLESVYTSKAYRGFESPSFRNA